MPERFVRDHVELADELMRRFAPIHGVVVLALVRGDDVALAVRAVVDRDAFDVRVQIAAFRLVDGRALLAAVRLRASTPTGRRLPRRCRAGRARRPPRSPRPASRLRSRAPARWPPCRCDRASATGDTCRRRCRSRSRSSRRTWRCDTCTGRTGSLMPDSSVPAAIDASRRVAAIEAVQADRARRAVGRRDDRRRLARRA